MSAKLRKVFWTTLVAFSFWDSMVQAQDTALNNKLDLIDIYKKEFPSTRERKIYKPKNSRVSFSILPAAAPDEQGAVMITTLVSTFYLGNPDSTKMSNVFFAPYANFNGRFVIPFRTYIYTKNNKYNLAGDYRFMIYPQGVYGLGKGPEEQEVSIITNRQLRIHQFISKKYKYNFFIGGGVQVDIYSNFSEKNLTGDSSDFMRYMKGNYSDFRSNGFAGQFLFDSRENTINSEKGHFGRFVLRMNTKAMGSTNSWSSFYSDVRKYISLSHRKHSVLSLWGLYWTILKGDPHYLDLPSIGWDVYGRSGRGIPKNRLRSNALLYFESEYRTDISKNGLVGMVVFANVSAPSTFGTQEFLKWYPAIGTGLRIKWDKVNRSNLTFDLGFSKNYWSWYVGINEYF